jgi:NAD+ synthase
MLDKDKLIIETENAIKWIKDYTTSQRVQGVVVGNSGGKDSAVVIAMAVKALGKENVISVSMPCNSISADYYDAKLVSDAFGVSLIKLDLTDTYNELERKIKININLTDESKINIKPRLRMTSLYAIAQTMGYLVIGTGNLCERMVGYTTKWGDNSSDFNPIANFTVQEVLKIGEYLKVPDKILKKAPSDGLGGKTDEEKMGIKYSQIAELIETGRLEDEVAKLEIIRRFNNSKHKREIVPIYQFERENFLENMM